MADESIDSLVTPEKTEDSRSISKSSASNSSSPSRPTAHANHSRASIGSTRNSTEKSDSANRNKTAVPHYLQASTGSCHDFCKYGKKDSSEEKARKPIRKRIAKSLSNERPVQIFISGKGNKERVVNNEPLTDTKNHSPDSKSISPKPETSLDKKKVIKNKPLKDTKIHSPDLPSAKNTPLRKPKNIPDAKIAYSSNQNVSSGNKSVLPRTKPSSTKKCASPDPPEIVKSVFFPSKKDEDPVKRGSLGDNKTLKAEKKTSNLSRKSCSPVKSKPVIKVKPLCFSSDNLDGIRGRGRKDGDSDTGRNKASAKKVVASRAASLSSPKHPIIKMGYNISRKAGNSEPVSNPKVINRTRRVDKTETPNNEKVPEKILHVIETKNDKSVVESTPDDQLISSLTSPPSDESLSDENSSFSSSHEEDNKEVTEYSVGEADERKAPPVKVNNNNKSLKKTKVVVSDDIKTRSPVKLKFKNGKLLDVQSNNNTPRRLRFKKASTIGAVEGKGDLRRGIYKKAAVNDDKAGEKVSSEKVVLKHQDVQGKKDARGLLNNVIEETASKLVESRKSKVKALVGAFETVISLQESKPSSQVVS